MKKFKKGDLVQFERISGLGIIIHVYPNYIEDPLYYVYWTSPTNIFNVVRESALRSPSDEEG